MKGASEEFLIRIKRSATAKDGLLSGELSVNGESLGTCYENADKMIPKGTYKGVLRYASGKNFVQGPGGVLGHSGDFLVEVAEVPHRTDILFHAGNKKEHSEGCILCGGHGEGWEEVRSICIAKNATGILRRARQTKRFAKQNHCNQSGITRGVAHSLL